MLECIRLKSKHYRTPMMMKKMFKIKKKTYCRKFPINHNSTNASVFTSPYPQIHIIKWMATVSTRDSGSERRKCVLWQGQGTYWHTYCKQHRNITWTHSAYRVVWQRICDVHNIFNSIWVQIGCPKSAINDDKFSGNEIFHLFRLRNVHSIKCLASKPRRRPC